MALIDKQLQSKMEKCYNSYYTDANGKNETQTMCYNMNNGVKYIIYFDEKKNNQINQQLNDNYQSKGVLYKNNHRLLDYDHWRHSFTNYFYQQNLKSKSYRMLKRLNKKKENDYHGSVTNGLMENYFFDVALLPLITLKL